MSLHLSPSRVLVPPQHKARASELLAYRNTSAEYQLMRHRKSRWKLATMDPEEYRAEEERLAAQASGNLLFEDGRGLWTYSGLAGMLARELGEQVVYQPRPDRRPLRWRRDPPPLRPYQRDALAAVLAAPPGPASVEMGTGLGKSLLIYNFVREVGGKSLIIAPTANIADQLLNGATMYFGSREVGPYFDGQKMPAKRIVVATFQSVSRVQDSEIAALLGQRDSLVVDEAHMCPAATLRRSCVGEGGASKGVVGDWAADIPHRLFVSGTMCRGDGQDLVLRGLVGDPVFEMTVRQGVEQGYLAEPHFLVGKYRSTAPYVRKDALYAERTHLFRSQEAAERIAGIQEEMLGRGWFVLTLVREMETAAVLSPHLRTPWELARGSEDRACKCRGRADCERCGGRGRAPVLPEKPVVEPAELVEQFNRGEVRHLVGTSCIGVGTDIHPPGQTGVVWVGGGRSGVDFPQAVGRGTRRQGKDWFCFWDFDPMNVPEAHSQAVERQRMMAEIYSPPTEVDLG